MDRSGAAGRRGRLRRIIASCLACCLLVVFAACGNDDPAGGGTKGEAASGGAAPDPGGDRPLVLGRAPWFRLTDQDGEAFGTDELLGRVWIGNFMFTRCRATCPIQLERLLELQERLKKHPDRAGIRVVSISVDPEHDRPPLLRAYAEANDADTAHWSFLTGDRKDIWLLSTFGFRLPAGPDPTNAEMPIGHSARLVLVDRRGRVRDLIDSQTDDCVDVVMRALGPLVVEPAPARVSTPDEVFHTPWLNRRKAAQIDAAKKWEVEHGFRFSNRLRESGIRFVNRVVDDAAKHYKAVHYDHGNGVAVADVDGDGLLDIYFSNQVGSNQLWRNAGGGKFENITRDAGVAVKDAIGVTASFADTDNDGDPDLFVTTVRGGNRFFENIGGGRFKDISKAAGLDHVGHSSSGVFFDYDRDGLLDLFLCNVGLYTTDHRRPVVNDSTTDGLESGTYHYYEGVLDAFSGHIKPERGEMSILYRNKGGNRFEDVSVKTALNDMSWTGAASPLDVNGDGLLDLYVLNMQGHDEYYENVSGAAFVRKSREVFPKTPWGSMGIKVFDFDGDGDFDIYITDMHSDMSQRVGPDEEKHKSEMVWSESILRSGGNSIWGNAFFRKDGPSSFAEISEQVGGESYWPWGISVDDLNADGYDDVFVASSMNFRYRYGINSLLLNDRGRGFLDSEFVLGVEPRAGPLIKPWFDLACGKGGEATGGLCEGVEGPAVVWAPLGSRASVIFDLDGDGDLDIVTNDFNSEPLVLVSDLAGREKHHFLKVKLRGTKSNRDGLGAVVRVHTGGRVLTKAHDGQSGYLSQSSKPLFFGLGTAVKVDRIEVRWLTGKTQVLEAPLPVDRLLVIEEE